MVQRKPMTSLYEAVRRFLEHPHDETGRSDFDYHLSLYEEAPPPSSSGGEWRPHPLSLHPPATAQSQALAKQIIEGQAELCGATIKIEPARRPQAQEMVDLLSKELQLDHVYCLNLIRAVSSEDVRLWVEHKVQPVGTSHSHGGGFDEYATPGGGAGGDRGSMMMVPLHEDLQASARFLFFIEKRAALNTLLELVQARIGMGLSETKQHAVMVATDALIGQGLPSILMQRIAIISREVKCRGRTPLEVEFEVERQKEADCLFFLFYQTQILPRELLPLPGSGAAGSAGSAGAGALVPAASATGGGVAASGGPVTLLGLIKQLTEELKRKFSVVAPGEEQHKSKEERALFKALATLLMTLITSLITLDGLLPRPGSSAVGERRNALLTYIKEEGKLDEAREKRKEHDKEHKAAHAAHATLPPETQAKLTTLEHAFKDAQTQVTQTFAHLRHELENGWANSGIQAVVLLAWGAFLQDDELAERLASVKEQRFLTQMRGDLLSRAMGQGVFGFVEGALVSCWKRPQQEDIQMFFLDVVGELLSVYLKEQHEIVRSLPGYGRTRPPAPPQAHAGAGGGSGVGAGTDGSGPDAAAQRKMAVESLISLLACLSESHGGLAERLLWTRGEGEPEPVQFVKDVSELVKNDHQLRGAWIQLLAAMATAPNEECKAATMDFLVDFSPFVSAQTRRSMDVLTYVLEDSILRAEQNQPLQRDLLLGVLLLIERVTCPALARDADLAFVRHVLPLLYSLLNYALVADLKGALFKALAPFAALPDGMARQLWEHLEMLHIVPARGKKEAWRYELEEVEVKMGSYPITEGCLTLLVALLRGDLPYDLGETTGRPDGVQGIQPYLDYLIDDVLLPLRTRPFADPAQKWKILAKGLEALLLVLERYPLVAEDDRLRNLGLSSIQRRLAKEEVIRDIDAVGPAPSAGFSLLLRLLSSSSTDPSRGTLLPLVMDVIAGAELSPPGSGGMASSMAIQQQHYGQRTPGFMGVGQQPHHSSLGGGKQEALPPGPWRLEHKTKLREAKAWDDAVLVFDDDPTRGFTYRWYGGGMRGPEDEVAWQEEAVKVGLELLNNVLVKDQEMKRLHAELPDHPFFRDVRVAAVHEILARGLGGGMRPHARGVSGRGSSATLISQGRVLPLIAEYTAYDHHPSLRLHASLCLRTIMGRVAQPQELLDMFRGLGGASSEEGLEQQQRALDAILKTLSHPGDPLDLEGSTLLEFGDLPRALNLLAKIHPSAAQVDRLVHFLVLDVLLKNLLPYRTTVSHLFLGYLVEEQPGPLRLPADPGAHGLFGLQLIVRNLSAPSFLTLAPLLAEKSFELVYRLVYAQKTVDATLVYLQRDDVDFFSREFALLSRRPFPIPPRAPPTEAGANNRRRSSLTAAHQQQTAQIRFFREQVAYASSLHVWAWLLKAMAVAIFYQESDKSKVRRLLEMLLTAPVVMRGASQPQADGGSVGEVHQDFETRALAFTELLQKIQLAHQRDVPQPPSEELRGVADRCSIPLPGPPEVRLFRGIVEDSFMNAVRTRLGTLGGGGGGAMPGGESRPGGPGAPVVGGGGGGVISPAQANGRPMMGGVPQATTWLLQEASTYCMHYNHFILRQAAEYHWCEAWKRLGEAILKECREVLLRPSMSFAPSGSGGNGSGASTELQILLAILAQTVGKLCQQPFGDIKALEHLSVVVMVAVDVMWRYAMARPGGISDTIMSVDEGQRVLELVLEALLRKNPNQVAVGDAGQLAQQKYRVQCYCALILFLRATSLLPLPEPVAGGRGDRDGATGPLLLTAGGGGGNSASSSTTAWLSDSSLLAARKERNAEVLTSPRFFRELVDVLAKDATFAPSFGKTRSRYQACAVSCLGVIIETLFSASAPADAALDGSLPSLPLGVAPGMGKYDTAIREILEKFPRLLEDLDPQFCVEKGQGPGEYGSFLSPSASRFVFSPHQDMSPMDTGRSTEALLEERPWDATFRFYVDMLVQVAQDARGAKMLLDRGLVDKLSRTRFLVALEDGDMPSLDPGRKEDLMDNMGCVLRLLQVMLAKLALNADLRPQVQEFLRRHTRVLLQFIEARQGDLRGLDEVGVVVGLLAHSVGVKGSGVLGHAAPASLAPAQDEYRRLVNDLFERFAIELLPPYAVRFQVRTQGWWAALEDFDDHVVPCEPPQGVNKQYAWRVSDAFKLLVSQTLLLHVTTYIRRRLRKAKYPNVRVETVLVSLRMCLTFLVAQGEGPAPPVPSLREVSRGGYPAVVAAKEGGRAPWDYDYLRTSLRRLFDNLLDILYHLVQYRVDLDPDFPKAAVHAELLKALQGHEEWLEKQTHVGAWPYLKMNLDAIQDKLRV